MTKSYTDFKSRYLGTAHNVDGAYGYQCWDGAMFYSKYLGYKVYNCTLTKYAQDIYNARITSGILKEYNDLGKTPRVGAIVVFKKSVQTPYSHIGIVDSFDNTYVTVLAQNQNGTGKFTLKKFNRAYILGVLNPKCFVPELPTAYLKLESSNHAQVKKLQKALNYVTGSTLKIDGVFGRKTENVVMAFQKKYGKNPPDGKGALVINGRYGERTKSVLKGELK